MSQPWIPGSTDRVGALADPDLLPGSLDGDGQRWLPTTNTGPSGLHVFLGVEYELKPVMVWDGTAYQPTEVMRWTGAGYLRAT